MNNEGDTVAEGDFDADAPLGATDGLADTD